jgi:hypothetical protein
MLSRDKAESQDLAKYDALVENLQNGNKERIKRKSVLVKNKDF